MENFSAAQVINNTITLNSAASEGGGLHIWDGTPSLINNIIWNNSSPYDPDIYDVSWTAQISYCNIGVLFNPSNYGPGNISEDPEFVDPGSYDFHLRAESPCINRGTDIGAPGEDLDHDSRPEMGTCDMGADEFTDTHLLAANTFTLSHPNGGTVYFGLDAGSANAGRWYVILGSRTGASPGLPLPGGPGTLPINWDNFTNLVLAQLNGPRFGNFLGILNGAGSASAQLNIGAGLFPPGWLGAHLTFAYALDNPIDYASNPVVVEVIP